MIVVQPAHILGWASVLGTLLVCVGLAALGYQLLPVAEPQQRASDHHPFTGEPTPAQQLVGRPILVSIDNFHDARPQSGIAAADIIHEVPMEDGITRLAALYHTEAPDPVGPIRSVRPYMVALAREVDAVLVHAGGSPMALDLIDHLEHPHVNLLEVPLGYRVPERVLPHNLYSNLAACRSHIEEQGWEWPTVPAPYMTFLDRDMTAGEAPAPTGRAHEVDVRYGRAVWEWQEDKTYRRHTWGQVHQDREEGPLHRHNVVVLSVPIADIPGDPSGRIIMEVNEGGSAWVVRDGAYWQGSWRLSGDGLEVVTAAGTPLPLVAGTTWVHWTPAGTPVRMGDVEVMP